MNEERWRQVGIFTVAEARTYTNTFEFAAWWETVAVEAGEYPVLECRGGVSGVLYVSIPGVVTEDYFQGHFGGAPFGKYDRTKNAGKPAEARLMVGKQTAGVTMWPEPGPWMGRAEALGEVASP